MDSEINAKTFWKAIGCRAIGVAIVTAKGTDGPAGFLALSATHLSASPPMMMVSMGLTTSALGAVRSPTISPSTMCPRAPTPWSRNSPARARSRGPTASCRAPGAAQDRRADAQRRRRRDRLPARRVDRAPWYGHRAGPRGGLQRFGQRATDQLPWRLSVTLAAKPDQNTLDRMQPNRARRPFMDVTRGASDDLPGPCSGHHGPSCATGGV